MAETKSVAGTQTEKNLATSYLNPNPTLGTLSMHRKL